MVNQGWKVKGSTTKSEKLELLEKEGIESYLLKIDSQGIDITDPSIFESECFYINIPPRRRLGELLERYPREIEQLINRISPDAKVVFISSTGVYPDHNQKQQEELKPSPTKESGKALLAAEQLVMSHFQNWIILRMAGLAGPNREPGRWFSGKQNIANGLNPVNMVHLQDCIALSHKIISSDIINNKLYNVCSDYHPAKHEFYVKQSQKLGIPPPQFNLELGQHKIIDNQKLKADLSYEFIFSDPMQF